jgi:hypothetical protein
MRRYGNYLFAVNTTSGRNCPLPTNKGFTHAPDHNFGKVLDLGHPVTVGPLTMVVLYLGK